MRHRLVWTTTATLAWVVMAAAACQTPDISGREPTLTQDGEPPASSSSGIPLHCSPDSPCWAEPDGTTCCQCIDEQTGTVTLWCEEPSDPSGAELDLPANCSPDSPCWAEPDGTTCCQCIDEQTGTVTLWCEDDP